ncbi:MAG: antitoxin [Acidimicrobiia bacterium]
MSKRLQVVLADAELVRFQEAARLAGTTLAEWVRRALRQAEREAATGDGAQKLAAIRTASFHSFPAPDIDRMLAEIEAGRG